MAFLSTYPFYEDGFKIVEAPYIGMEHQSAIAYGNNFTKGTYKGNDVSKTGWGKKQTESLFMRCHMNGSGIIVLRPAILPTGGFRKDLPVWLKNFYFQICLKKNGRGVSFREIQNY